MKKLIIFLMILITGNITNAQVEYFQGGSICPDENWHLVYEDNFEGNSIKTDDYNFARHLLEPMTTTKWKRKWYGINIRHGKFDKAAEILDRLPARDQEEIYFKDVQHINLKRFKGIRDSVWTITEDDLDKLVEVAASPYPSRGYAWSLYRLLTGVKLSAGLPSVVDELGKRAVESKREEKNIKRRLVRYSIYPNPVSDELFVDMGNETQSMIVEIYDTYGIQVYHEKVASSYVKIDVSQMRTGVYLVSISRNDGTKVVKKIFIK